MFLFGKRRRNREVERAAAEVMRPAWLRALLMILLFGAMVALYWRHFDDRLADIQARSAFFDETGAWTAADKRALARRAVLFREQWGIRLSAHARDAAPLLPRLSGTTLFVGLNPAGGEAVIILPALAARALREESAGRGKDVRLELEEQLGRCLKREPSADCLLKTLDELQTLLGRF